jgi:hypothetical protein
VFLHVGVDGRVAMEFEHGFFLAEVKPRVHGKVGCDPVHGVSWSSGQHCVVKAVDKLDQAHALAIQIFIVHPEGWLPRH